MYRQQEYGSALLLALILLLVLSLLAISGMEGSLMQERMSTAQREGVMALEIAESGAQDAETWIEEDVVTLTEFDGSDGLYDATEDGEQSPDPHSADIWASDSTQTRTADSVEGVTPRYFIEYMGEGFAPEELTDGNIGGYQHDSGGSDTHAFRIVVRAEGPSGRGQRMIEVFYTRQI
ncbi:PilX N-terminal domain-containing pilus assembly protein [Halospina sp. K52047b]|uniref:pilus assembly PilX family protein n=1 Tax=Halospina sp. K52047b TaxID=2614160 RepID=UPI00124A4C71|nr:PilX N-terminal domain-containing pilus assembly protein [Halospina sp. K52047b]KAA8982440.1 hypothetical protein F3089_07910 [Halospina sp. K52047b]